MMDIDLDKIVLLERQVSPQGWNLDNFKQSLTHNDCFILEGVNYSSILGFYILQKILDEVHILNICITPEYQRMGWGEALLNQIILESVQNNACDIHLEVRISNLAARNLYHKLGFNDVGVRKNYYSSGEQREDALQMCLALRLPNFN